MIRYQNSDGSWQEWSPIRYSPMLRKRVKRSDGTYIWRMLASTQDSRKLASQSRLAYDQAVQKQLASLG